MNKIVINRLFHGNASVRSHIVNKALLNEEDLLIELKDTGEQMIIPYEELIKRGKWSKQRFKSRYGDFSYQLVDYPFKSHYRQNRLL